MRFYKVQYTMLRVQMFLTGLGITVVGIFIQPQCLFGVHMGRAVHIGNCQRHI